MLNQLSEQVKKSAQPASDLFAVNVKALQEVAQQQTSLLSGMLSDSIRLIESVGQQTEINGIVAAQSVYAESLRERLTSTSKTALSTFTHARQELSDVMKSSLETSETSATPAKKAAPAKKATVKKAPVKKAAPKKTAPKKAAPKKAETEVKTATTNAAASKASEVKVDETKALEKKVSKPATKATRAKTASAKKASNPVPTLSADNVRATPKKEAAKTTIDTPNA